MAAAGRESALALTARCVGPLPLPQAWHCDQGHYKPRLIDAAALAVLNR